MYDRKTWIALSLCGALMVGYSTYQSKVQKQKLAQQEQQKTEQAPLSATAPQALPQVAPPELTVPQSAETAEEKIVTLETEKAIFRFTNLGGGVKNVEFKEQLNVHSKTEHVVINGNGDAPIASLTSAGEVLDTSVYTFNEAASVAGKSVVLETTTPTGLVVRKTFSIVAGKPGADYQLALDVSFKNTAAQAVSLAQNGLYLGAAAPLYEAEWANQTGFFWNADNKIHFTDVTSFKGTSFVGIAFSGDKSVINSGSVDNVDYAGVTNQFFTTVLRANGAQTTQVWGQPLDYKIPGSDKALKAVRGALQLPAVTLAPGEAKEIGYTLFVGPKNNNMLRQMGDNWSDVMQYGMFSPVSRFLNWVLKWLHAVFAHTADKWSWGLAIIALTILVRSAIWPLHAKSTRTMKRMSKLQPEMAKIKEKHAADPQKMNQEMMKLYSTYGVNPLGGCLPMLIQIPIFFGFYRMLQYAVELRGQGFLWVPDLSQPDTFHTFHLPFALPFIGTTLPINILPILMAITSFLQMKMTPKSGDVAQQRIVMLMPFVFFFFCYNFASALALYWTTQNIFSIAQTWLMNRIPEPELKARAPKKSWVQKFADKQAELQKLQQQRNAGGNNDTPKKPRTPRTGG